MQEGTPEIKRGMGGELCTGVSGLRKKICLVEDDKTIAKNLIRLLQSEGFAVGHAGTQREASAMLAESRFDMALVDISLPDGNGFAA